MQKIFTEEQVDGILELVLITVMLDRYPLDRQEIRIHVRCVLNMLNIGLLTECASQISGTLNEVTNVYSVDVR
jgi:hypothetical protein